MLINIVVLLFLMWVDTSQCGDGNSTSQNEGKGQNRGHFATDNTKVDIFSDGNYTDKEGNSSMYSDPAIPVYNSKESIHSNQTTERVFLEGPKPPEVLLVDEPTTALPEMRYVEAMLTPPIPILVCPHCLPSFVGGEKFYQSTTLWNSLLCGRSVCNKSNQAAPCGPFVCDNCFCDAKCSRYGDCCPDFYESQVAEQELPVSCIPVVLIQYKHPSHLRYKVISGCPLDSAISNNQDAVNKCHNTDPLDVVANIPVYSPSTGLHYKNKHCALCWSLSEVTPWSVESFCNSPVDLSGLRSREAVFELMRKDESCGVLVSPPSSPHRPHECTYQDTLIQTCNVTGRWGKYDPDFERACSLFSQPIHIKYNTVDFHYRNVFCARCNGHELPHATPHCNDRVVVPHVAQFSLIFNVMEQRDVSYVTVPLERREMCQSDQIYDIVAAHCRPLVCPFGKIPENHGCVNLLHSAEGLGYIIHIVLLPRNTSYVVVTNLDNFASNIQLTIYNAVISLSPRGFVTNIELEFSQMQESLTVHLQKIDIQFSVIVGVKIPRDEAEKKLVGLLRRNWWWYEEKAVMPIYFDLIWLHDLSNERLKAVTSTHSIMSPSSFYKHQTERYVFNNLHQNDLPSVYLNNVLSYILVSELLLCDMIELNSTEYESADDKTIIVKSSGSELKEGQFLWRGNDVRVCINKTFTKEDLQTPPEGAISYSDLTEIYLTIICTTLSLLGLAATVFIYVCSGQSRTLPGKNSMFLFCNLFLAQLLFLTGSAANVNTQTCQALGIVIHYFWLGTFFWKVVAAFHMYRVLTSPFKPINKTIALVKYVLFCQLSPALIISFIVLFNSGTSNNTRIGYAGKEIGNGYFFCFLSTSIDLAIGFVLPVGIAIFINAVFFVRIVHSLRSRTRLNRSSVKSDAKESAIYMKISLVFGLTWVIGFIALVVNVSGFWFLFTITNASIGLFIFLSFGVKKIPLRLIPKSRQCSSSQESPDPGFARRELGDARFQSQLTLQTPCSSVANSPALAVRDLESSA